MTGQEMEQFARIAAIVAGIVFGGWALSSVIWVWTKKQIYAYGGSALSVVGIILMGLSIYKTVDVSAAPDKIGIKLGELEKAIEKQQTALAGIPSDLDKRLTQLNDGIIQQTAAQAARFNKLEAANSVQILKAAASSSDRAGKTMLDVGGVLPPKAPVNISGPQFSRKSVDAIDQLGRIITLIVESTDTTASLRGKIDEFSKLADSYSPEFSTALIRLGDLYRAEGRNKEAESSYKQALEILEASRKNNAPPPEKK